MEDFKAEGKAYNPDREKVLDYVCMEVLGSNSPTKDGVYSPMGPLLPDCLPEAHRAELTCHVPSDRKPMKS